MNNKLVVLLTSGILSLAIEAGDAGSATWKLNPASNREWNRPFNWEPKVVPNGPDDTATFAVSEVPEAIIMYDTEVNSVVFTSDASAFDISVDRDGSSGFNFTISGIGITNDSRITQNFDVNVFRTIQFTNSATAGGLTVFTASGGGIYFFNTSTARDAMLVAQDAVGSITIGGVISFQDDSDGGSSRVDVIDNGSLAVDSHNAAGVTIGSLEGNGSVFLGANDLLVGANDLSTSFSGLIEDGANGTGGSLIKIGQGTLTLTGANSYTGGTNIKNGILLVNNTVDSGTGSNRVQVTAGTLGGIGIITGTVVVGKGSGSGAILGPGTGGVTPGTLTIRKKLTLMADATYRVTLNSSTLAADTVSARGVKIREAQIVFNDLSNSVIPPGTVFTMIDNMGTAPIESTFANLADGATITVGNNTFQASYEGGDGNDLTLTVVP